MKIIAFVVLTSVVPTSVAMAEDFSPSSTQILYKEQCSECHGANGVSPIDRYPNVAGQKKGYLQTEMLAFKSGSRPGTIMPSIAEGLTEKEIEELSLYMAKMKCAP